MDHCTKSQGRYHEERSNKRLPEESVGENPNQTGNSGPERGDNNRKTEIAGNPLTAAKSMKQRLLISKDQKKTKHRGQRAGQKLDTEHGNSSSPADIEQQDHDAPDHAKLPDDIHGAGISTISASRVALSKKPENKDRKID